MGLEKITINFMGNNIVAQCPNKLCASFSYMDLDLVFVRLSIYEQLRLILRLAFDAFHCL